ncbi:TonB-dependent receptor [Bowmanella sp. Y26]|uniref:TonB-dependent receptor n=1 Tax=Bowmanella yangjiangensis TaxID=2811230 RepID=UPI001BDC27CF|nr:TonB-dependent receptor [Bowmanella yangjiangensis]MBT1062424.1 TonB-dependent receptor [Bowmanella yangjiangensis]
MIRKNRIAKAVQYSLLLGSVSISQATFAQETQPSDDSLLEEEVIEKVAVTGSRIRKAEFSSASPVQVISGEISREMGLFNAEDMLQTTNQASGLQIDNSFGGFVLDNGPGASTIGFRGLGAERTLVIMNGRRIAPAGVGGAPVSPDLNLIPGVMIERVENLFDGASTVYGSDAIAGVANIILRKDVEGFELEGSYSNPQAGGAEEEVLSAMWGKTTDNGFITVGLEYNNQRRQSLGQNEFTGDCTEMYYEDEQGNKLTQYRSVSPSSNPVDSCYLFPLTNRIQAENFWGSLYHTPGSTNVGIPNFSESGVPFVYAGLFPDWVAVDGNGDGIPDSAIVDGNGDGLQDFSFQDPYYGYERTDRANSADFINPLKRYSAMANGEYSFGDDNDTTVFFEALYARRKSEFFAPGAQIFPWVPKTNPFNPCGTFAPNCEASIGIDRGGVRTRPLLNGIQGDRDVYKIDVEQYRLLTGVKGNIGAFDNIGLGNWAYEVYAGYSASNGEDSRNGINAERLYHSLDTTVLNEDGSYSCGNGSDGCVPVNLFADNMFALGGGRFTEAEEDYLFTERYMETKVKQSIISGYVTGDLFSLPWNDEVVPMVFGAEFRKDEIESNPNDVASKGLLLHYFTDQGADGSRNMREVFTEFEFPLLRGKEWAEELTLTASGRWTDESYYDPASTYSLKMVYRPVEWFTVRGTKGTSYRAPNLRERFLNGTTGFNSVFDPCVVPESARVESLDPNLPSTYDAAEETRLARVMTACSNNNVDPTALGLGLTGTSFTGNINTEIVTGGSEELKEENSTAKTYGFVFEQPFIEDVELTFSMSWYDIEITDAIVEPNRQYIINQCYDNEQVPDGSSGFCSRITRNSAGRIELIDASFINAGLYTSKGLDYNLYYNQEFVFDGKALDVVLDIQATQMKEQVSDILGTIDDNVGEPAMPEWRASARLSLGYDDFRLSWITRFIGAGELDKPEEFDGGYAPCDGLDVQCRPVWYTEDYYRHDVSLNWSKDNYSVTFGIRNLLNEAPPKADDGGVFSNRNVPLGIGYDLFGRTAYLNFGVDF